MRSGYHGYEPLVGHRKSFHTALCNAVAMFIIALISVSAVFHLRDTLQKSALGVNGETFVGGDATLEPLAQDVDSIDSIRRRDDLELQREVAKDRAEIERDEAILNDDGAVGITSAVTSRKSSEANTKTVKAAGAKETSKNKAGSAGKPAKSQVKMDAEELQVMSDLCKDETREAFCSDHGEPQEKDGHCVCKCDKFHRGDKCESPTPCASKDPKDLCNGRGDLIDIHGHRLVSDGVSGRIMDCGCQCQKFASGDFCEKTGPCFNRNAKDYCNDHGSIFETTADGDQICKCSCEPEWVGNKCDKRKQD